jgi:hypothetical protein
MDILTEIEVVEIPFFWELVPISTKREINRIPQVNPESRTDV